MPSRVVDIEQEAAKREIRRRIARLRRQLDRRVRSVRREGHRLTSWRTYAARFPGGAMTAAFGVGLALAVGLSGRRLLRLAALRLLRRGLAQVGEGLWRELGHLWAASTPGPAGPPEEPRRA